MLVVCDKRGLSIQCRVCSHSVAHVPEHRNGGPFTCDGGEQCAAGVAVVMNMVLSGCCVQNSVDRQIGEVRCIPVSEIGEDLIPLLRRVEVAFGKVLDEAPRPVSWQEKLTDVKWAQGRLAELRKALGKV